MKVKELRERERLTVEGFSQRIGAAKRTIFYWESKSLRVDSENILRPYRNAMIRMARKYRT